MPNMSDKFGDFCVLLVEDDMQSMSLIRSMLNDLGVYQVHTADNGLKAKIFLENQHTKDLINVMLCDWNLPLVSGIDLLRHVRHSNPDMPFLMITGLADERSVKEARAAGVSGYIRKPFSVDDLRKKLRIVQNILAIRSTAAHLGGPGH
jgi:CheY-like chemotaxis protein